MPTNTMEEQIKALHEVGAHFGRNRSRRHPDMTPYVFGSRNRTDIIDLEKTVTELDAAKAMMKKLGADKAHILFVGTKPEARNTTMVEAQKLGHSFVERRWIGGTLTNYIEIKKRIDTLVTLRSQQEAGTLVAKTKKEKLMLERKIIKLQAMFGGLVDMKGAPAAMVVVDPRKEYIAVSEAASMQVPVIAIAGTDCSLEGVTQVVPANDSSKSTIDSIMATLTEAYNAQ